MNRKLFYVLALILLLVGVGSSSELVRGAYFKYYDLLLNDDVFEIQGERFSLENGWVVESVGKGRLTTKKAGLVKSESEIITIFPKDEMENPCKEVMEYISNNGFSISRCVFNNKKGDQDILVYDFIDHEMFVFALEEEVVNSFISNLEFMRPE